MRESGVSWTPLLVYTSFHEVDTRQPDVMATDACTGTEFHEWRDKNLYCFEEHNWAATGRKLDSWPAVVSLIEPKVGLEVQE